MEYAFKIREHPLTAYLYLNILLLAPSSAAHLIL